MVFKFLQQSTYVSFLLSLKFCALTLKCQYRLNISGNSVIQHSMTFFCISNDQSPMIFLDLNSSAAVNSSKGERIRRRGGGGGYGTGYRNSKLTKKTKIYKQKPDRSDSRQFSR